MMAHVTRDEGRAGYRYAPYYCEENVHLLARDRITTGAAGAVVLVSNPTRRIALAAQRAGGRSGLAVWDYHVIYLEDGLVFDLDTALTVPTPALAYVAATFPGPLRDPNSPYRPWFSLVHAPRYLDVFSSNRDHMRDDEGGYLQPPPPWPPIYRPDLGNTLFALVDGEHEAVTAYGCRFPDAGVLR